MKLHVQMCTLLYAGLIRNQLHFNCYLNNKPTFYKPNYLALDIGHCDTNVFVWYPILFSEITHTKSTDLVPWSYCIFWTVTMWTSEPREHNYAKCCKYTLVLMDTKRFNMYLVALVHTCIRCYMWGF